MKPYIAHPRDPSRGVTEEHDLVEHLNSVSGLAVFFAQRFMQETKCLEVSGLLHDLGKANGNFYNYLTKGYPGPTGPFVKPGRHPRISALIAQDLGYGLASYVIDHHHGGYYNLSDKFDDEGKGNFRDKMLASRSSIKRGPGRLLQHDVDAQWYRESADWLSACQSAGLINLPDVQEVRQEVLDLKHGSKNPSMWLRMLMSCLVDADRLDTAFHGSPDSFMSRYLNFQTDSIQTLAKLSKQRFDDLVATVPSSPINTLRSSIHRRALSDASQPPGFFDLEVPTGGGKTLTAARFAIEHARAHNMDRVFFVVPYLSVLEQNVGVYRSLFDTATEMNVLEHHSNLSMEYFLEVLESQGKTKSTLGDYTQRLEGAIENWDMPVVVTTTVQFCETLYKNWCSRLRRLHRVPRSVIVIDEYQTLPYNLLHPIMKSLEEMVENYGCSVIFSSATSSQRHWVKNGLLTQVPHILSDPAINKAAPLQRVDFEYDDTRKTWSEVADMVNGVTGSSLNILNLKNGCIELLPKIKDQMNLYHLSSALIPAHRTEVIQEIHARLAQGAKTTLVATPVVRAGVDLDFPVGHVQLSGIDSIMQVAGRINREGKLGSGLLKVFDTEEQRVFPTQQERHAQVIASQILNSMTNGKLTEQDIRRYYARFYTMGTLDVFDNPSQDNTPVLSAESVLSLRTVGHSFKMIPDVQLPVLVHWKNRQEVEDALTNPRRSKEDWLLLQRHSLTLWQGEVDACLLDGRITQRTIGKEEFLVWTGHYCPKVGLLHKLPYQGQMIF